MQRGMEKVLALGKEVPYLKDLGVDHQAALCCNRKPMRQLFHPPNPELQVLR